MVIPVRHRLARLEVLREARLLPMLVDLGQMVQVSLVVPVAGEGASQVHFIQRVLHCLFVN